MRVTCPECGAEYDVPDTALHAARRLRCSACGASWDWTPPATPKPEPARTEPPLREEPAAATPEPESPPEPSPGPARQPVREPPRIEVIPERRIMPPEPPPSPRQKGMVMLAWAASLALLIAALVAIYVWRAPIMRAWPPAIRLFAALGLA